jgi:hypothetical protein
LWQDARAIQSKEPKMNMTSNACNARMRIALQFAQEAILEDHDHPAAVRHLRRALQHAVGAKQGRAWSKIMLAIRELSRVAPEREGTAQQP